MLCWFYVCFYLHCWCSINILNIYLLIIYFLSSMYHHYYYISIISKVLSHTVQVVRSHGSSSPKTRSECSWAEWSAGRDVRFPHCLLECTYFDKLIIRKLYLHRKNFVTPNIIKFKDLLTSTNFETLNLLTKFMKKMLNVCSS